MLNKGAAIVIGLLILLLLITGWYAASLTRIRPFIQSGPFDMGTLTNAELIQTNTTGTLQYQGTTQSATEFNNGNITFNDFNMNFYNGDMTNPPWQLRSDRGTVTDNNTLITLIGHVNLSRAATKGDFPIAATTDTALIDPNMQKVTGPDLITITEPGTTNQTSGIGFIADIQAKTLNLLSDVQGTYVPISH